MATVRFTPCLRRHFELPDGETLAFGATSGNAYVSEDGGGSWQVLSHDLPLVHSLRFA